MSNYKLGLGSQGAGILMWFPYRALDLLWSWAVIPVPLK